jgi:hypothetical protein
MENFLKTRLKLRKQMTSNTVFGGVNKIVAPGENQLRGGLIRTQTALKAFNLS